VTKLINKEQRARKKLQSMSRQSTAQLAEEFFPETRRDSYLYVAPTELKYIVDIELIQVILAGLLKSLQINNKLFRRKRKNYREILCLDSRSGRE
jgi:hypothetical protein